MSVPVMEAHSGPFHSWDSLSDTGKQMYLSDVKGEF